MEQEFWQEFIKNGAVLMWIVAFFVISGSMFIFSIFQKKSDKGDRWFLASCLLSFPCSSFTAVLCGIAFFEEKWSSLGKGFITYLFFLALALACFIIGRYKLKKEIKAPDSAEVEEIEKEEIEKEEMEKEEKKEEAEKESEEESLPAEKIETNQEKQAIKIGILVKQVWDTETKIKVKDDKSGIEEPIEVKWVINPYDEYGIAEALKLKESISGAKTVVISAGPERAIETIRKALAMGIDDAIHVANDALDSSNSSTIAEALAKAIKSEKEPFDIIFAGKQAMDYDNSQVPLMLAEKLNIPCITDVSKFEFKKEEKKVLVTKEVEGGTKEKWEMPTPCIVARTKGTDETKYETLQGIMKAKKKIDNKEYKKITLELPEQTIKTEIIKFEPPPKKEAGTIIEAEGKETEAAKKLIEFLRKEGIV